MSEFKLPQHYTGGILFSVIQTLNCILHERPKLPANIKKKTDIIYVFITVQEKNEVATTLTYFTLIVLFKGQLKNEENTKLISAKSP